MVLPAILLAATAIAGGGVFGFTSRQKTIREKEETLQAREETKQLGIEKDREAQKLNAPISSQVGATAGVGDDLIALFKEHTVAIVLGVVVVVGLIVLLARGGK